MSSTVKKIISVAAPLAALIPGVGLPAAVAIGAGGGLLGGGGLKGALTGGLSAGALGGGGGLLGSALGLTGPAASAVGTGLLGAGAGAANSGLKGALVGGLTGAAGGYLGNGGNIPGFTGEGSLLGTPAGAPLEGGVGPTQGSGLIGSITKGLSSVGSGLSNLASPISAGGGGSSYGGSSSNALGATASLVGGLNSLNANDKAQKALLNSQTQSLSELQPYLQTGAGANAALSDALGVSGNTSAPGYGSLTESFNPGDLTQTPGYNFQLQQGQQALDRQAAAKGDYFSGGAIKDAENYAQGLAGTTYQNAYQDWLASQQQKYGMLSGASNAGQGAAGAATGVFDNTGNARANADISSSNIMNSMLSGLLSGSAGRKPVMVGNQVYYM